MMNRIFGRSAARAGGGAEGMEQKAAKKEIASLGGRLRDMDREPQTGGESREWAAEAECLAAQNNVAAPAEQPSPVSSPEWRHRTAHFAPWFIHFLWLAAGVATIVYLKNRNWGAFESLPLVIAAVIGMSAWLQWTVAWSMLARRPVADRLAYFLVGVVGILIVSDWILEWRRSSWALPLALGTMAVGYALPLSLVYWRGWRIASQPGPGQQSTRAASRRGQFSIGEVILLTAGVSLWLGLMTAQRSLMGAWGETVALHVMIICGTMLVVVGLAARRPAMATSIVLLVCLTIVAATIAWFNGNAVGSPNTWLLLGLICSPGFIGLVASIALVRWCGYRLLPGAPPGGGGQAQRCERSGGRVIP